MFNKVSKKEVGTRMILASEEVSDLFIIVGWYQDIFLIELRAHSSFLNCIVWISGIVGLPVYAPFWILPARYQRQLSSTPYQSL
jgi:hypothetical protein